MGFREVPDYVADLAAKLLASATPTVMGTKQSTTVRSGLASR